MNTNGSKDRLDDFAKRANYAPDSVYHHQQRGWAYIPIQPFADEQENLTRLDITPDDCWSVDAYWCTEEDVYFIQVWANRLNASTNDPGLFCRWSNGEPAFLNLVARVSDRYVTRAKFEALMSRLHDLISSELEGYGPSLGSTLVFLAPENGS